VVLGRDIPAIETDGRPNPHFWLDPSLVGRYYVPRIRDELTAVDPAGAATYASAATAYLARLTDLDATLAAKVATLPTAARKLVTFHDAFPYLARHFGFELVGVVVQNVGQEPTAAELAKLVDAVRAAGVKAVFSEAQFNPKLVETLASEAGIEHVVTTLYSDALGPAPADSYMGLMTWDLDRIVEALG
jgi:ABC-type Zn uptake system ZnuABC Zn-binding protein ZnuA